LELLVRGFEDVGVANLEDLHTKGRCEDLIFLIGSIVEKEVGCTAYCIENELFTLSYFLPLHSSYHLGHVLAQ
jgi:hypothetical protein